MGFSPWRQSQIRRTLIDLARHHFGPEGLGANHHSDGKAADDGRLKHLADNRSTGPQTLQQWAEFHEAVEQLPAPTREVFEMIWYGGLEQATVAEWLDVSVPTVQRRWYQAQHLLYLQTGGQSPLDESRS